MPSKSTKQQHFFGMVHALQTGKASLADMPAGIRSKLSKTAHSISKKASGDFAKEVEEQLFFPGLSFKEYLVVESELVEALDELSSDEYDALVEACGMKKGVEDEEPCKSEKILKTAAKRGGKKAVNLSEKWKEEADIPENKKGMFKDWTVAELESELAKLKKSGPHEKGSAEYTKEKEINFALRAKHGWGRAK